MSDNSKTSTYPFTDENFSLDQLYLKPTTVEYTFHSPPKANYKVMFGDNNNTFIQMYLKNPPNRFQRWLTYKVFGVKIEKIEE